MLLEDLPAFLPSHMMTAIGDGEHTRKNARDNK